jgi:hypothetical protein
MSAVAAFKLFDNPIRSQISWNLLIHKELSASQLSNLIKKTSLSTITRNLAKMEKNGVIFVSRTEKRKNLELKFWKLNVELFEEEDLDIDVGLYNTLNEAEKKLFIERVTNIISLFFGFVRSMLEPENFDIEEILTHPERDHPSITITMMKKKAGDLFRKEFNKIIQRFKEEKEEEFQTSLEDLDLESYLIFFFSSKIKTLVPSLDE